MNSTRKLIEFCLGYFFFYTLNGIGLKYFTGALSSGLGGMSDIEYLVYSTIGGNLVCILVVLTFKWYRHNWTKRELLYIIPSGFCTAVVIPTTTLMYLLPISVMVAMVIMRGSIIVVSRIVDEIQIRQGLLKKKVKWEENVAVVFAMIAVSSKIFFSTGASSEDQFKFLTHPIAMTILVAYVTAYAIRIYIMNYYKNTRDPNVPYDNKGFFAIEQIVSTTVLFCIGLFLFLKVDMANETSAYLLDFKGSLLAPKPGIWGAIATGTTFGAVAFFSVFLFMFQGRSATFNGLVNRLTSLVAGTASTLIFAFVFVGKYPTNDDWVSMIFILISVGFLARAEMQHHTPK